MADYNPTTVYHLLELGTAAGIGAAIDKQLNRFGIATGRTDPQLVQKLAAADTALLSFLAGKLADAIYAQP